MKPPIFIVASSGDLFVFSSVAAAEMALESPDVESGEYANAFDATGTRLSVEVTEPTRRRRFLFVSTLTLSPVRISVKSAPCEGAAELRQLLASKLSDRVSELAALVERASRELVES